MQKAARKGKYGAHGWKGVRLQFENLTIEAESVATVVGSQTSDFGAPVVKAGVDKVRE